MPLGVVKANITLKGSRESTACVALVDTGAAMSVVDRELADHVGVTYTGRKRALTSATGHRLEGEIAMVREMLVEGEVLDYATFIAVSFSEEVREALRKLDISDPIILGLTTVELAGFLPDTSTGKLRKIETFLF